VKKRRIAVIISSFYKEIWEIKHFIIKIMHNIEYVDTIEIIKYLKVLQHVLDHR